MNERIKELAEQAGMTDDKFGMYFAKDKHNEDGVDLEKFAELIVEECVSICEKDGQWYTNTGWLAEAGEALSLSEQIKEHFGVK